MSQFDKDLSRLNECVHVLRFENLGYVFVTEHFFYDVLKNFLAFLGWNILTSQTLVQDVDHLSAEVDDQVRIDVDDAAWLWNVGVHIWFKMLIIEMKSINI